MSFSYYETLHFCIGLRLKWQTGFPMKAGYANKMEKINNRMLVFEVKRRIRYLEEFKKLFIEYYKNVRYEEWPWSSELPIPNKMAKEVRKQINHILSRVRESLNMSTNHLLINSPCNSNTISEANICLRRICELTREDLKKRVLLDAIEQAIGTYKSNIFSSWIRTINPFYWLERAYNYLRPFIDIIMLYIKNKFGAP